MYNRTRLHNVHAFGGLLFYTTHANIPMYTLPYPYFVSRTFISSLLFRFHATLFRPFCL